MTEDKYYSVDETAKRIGRTPRTVNRLLRAKRVPGARWIPEFGRWAIPESAFPAMASVVGKTLLIGGETYLPATEFARRKGVTRQRIHQLTEEGRLPVKRIGWHVFIAEKLLGGKRDGNSDESNGASGT